MKIFSFDAETNGLWGKAFSIGAVVTDTSGQEIASFIARCPITEETNPWVAENVLPQMEKIRVIHSNYKSMLKDFMSFYMEHKENADIIVHMGLPVEARLFIDAHNLGYLGDWDAPYPLIDISAFPEIGTSVDEYNRKNALSVPNCEGGTHNPIYDSRAAAIAYKNLDQRRNEKC